MSGGYYTVAGPDDEPIAAAPSIEELIDTLEEQAGTADPDDMFERY